MATGARYRWFQLDHRRDHPRPGGGQAGDAIDPSSPPLTPETGFRIVTARTSGRAKPAFNLWYHRSWSPRSRGWLHVLNEHQNHGVTDVPIIAYDRLTAGWNTPPESVTVSRNDVTKSSHRPSRCIDSRGSWRSSKVSCLTLRRSVSDDTRPRRHADNGRQRSWWKGAYYGS